MKYLLPAAALLAFLLLGFGWSGPQATPEPGQPRIPNYTMAEMRAIAELSDRLDVASRRMWEFSTFKDDLQNALWACEVGPFRAADEVLEKARQLSPVFLEVCHLRYPNLSDREVVLMTLLSSMRRDAIDGDAPVGSAATVLEETLCELFTSGEMTPALERELAKMGLPNASK